MVLNRKRGFRNRVSKLTQVGYLSVTAYKGIRDDDKVSAKTNLTCFYLAVSL